jgi:GAF domain-containing protein
VQSYQSKNAYSKDDREILEFIAEQISTLLIKKKAQEELSMVQNRLELATSMLRHDIANDLGVISSALKLYKRAEKKELLLEMEK